MIFFSRIVRAHILTNHTRAHSFFSPQDLCQPEWIEEDPEIFYGFWGMCFNDYRGAQPHEGYAILQRWLQRRFSVNLAAQEIRLFVKSMKSGMM